MLITLQQSHHILRIAIECRDRSRPVGVNQVKGFGAKCQDTNVDKGAIVSPSGFWETARTKAQQLGISCLKLEEVDSLDWLFSPGVTVISRKLIQTDWTLVPVDPSIKEKMKGFSLVNPEGAVVDNSSLNSNVVTRLGQMPPIEEEGTGKKIRMVFEGDGVFLKENQTRDTHPVRVTIANASTK